MDNYIEREALRMELFGLTVMDDAVAAYADAVLDRIKRAPAADVVPVVRCRECIHRHTGGCPMVNYCNEIDGHAMPLDDDFCSYGEKEATND